MIEIKKEGNAQETSNEKNLKLLMSMIYSSVISKEDIKEDMTMEIYKHFGIINYKGEVIYHINKGEESNIYHTEIENIFKTYDDETYSWDRFVFEHSKWIRRAIKRKEEEEEFRRKAIQNELKKSKDERQSALKKSKDEIEKLIDSYSKLLGYDDDSTRVLRVYLFDRIEKERNKIKEL